MEAMFELSLKERQNQLFLIIIINGDFKRKKKTSYFE